MHEKGVQHIKRWLGETWEEILKRTEHLRRGGTLKAPLEVGEVDVHETGSDTEPDEVTPKSKRPRLLH